MYIISNFTSNFLKMMKNHLYHTAIFLLFLWFNIAMNIQAQTHQHDLQSVTNVNNYVGVSMVSLADPYLSVLNYSGLGLRLEYNELKYYNPAKPVWVEFARIEGLGAMTYNPAYTAMITYVGTEIAYGTLYEYRDLNNIVLHAGGNIDANYAVKMNSRNVNNPTNMDIATNLNAMIGIRYNIPTKKRVMQLATQIEFPLLGCMFVPYPGLSYYEMYNSKKVAEAIHFSSLHNKQGVRQRLTFQMPFKYSSWTVGVSMQALKYQASEQPYQMQEFSVFLGVNYDVARFAGRKSNKPENFISPGL